jgi:hypothetical protein
MKKKIYNFFVYISLILINFSVKTNSYKLCAFVIWLNIRKLKIIKSSFKSKKNILVFPKSNGTEDLIQAFENKNTNLIFFLLPRSFIKKIYFHYFDEKYKKDYFTKLNKQEDLRKKNLYVNFLTLVFKSLNRFIKLDGYICFNIFYYAEKYFEEVCINLNSKLLVLHKESTFSPLEEKISEIVYSKFNTKSLSNKISVYTENQKKLLIKSKIGHKKQIFVIGTPRSDYAFSLRKIAPKEKIIVFYLIEYNLSKTSLIGSYGHKTQNWSKLYNQTIKYLFEFAKKNPDIQIILKGKTGVHHKEQPNLKNLPRNCIFIDGGAGHLLLKNASVVIAFNSTTVFEAIASNRNLIIPNFNNENKIYKNFLFKIKNKKYFVNSKIQFHKKIKFYLDLKYKNKKLSTPDIKTLKYYLGNTVANASTKLRKFLEKTIK